MINVNSKKAFVRRYSKNPIITNEMVPYSCRGVFNSTAIKHQGRYYMVLRCEGYNLFDFFMVAESENGYDDWKVVGDIIPMPETEEFQTYGHNYYDPRLTKLGDTIYMTFCCHADEARMALMTTKDLKTFNFEGFITGPGFRNTVFFPEKIDGLFTALERPNAVGDIWVTQSPDCKFWGNHQLLVAGGKHTVGIWAQNKIGPCGTPIKTPDGWLIIFHAVQPVCDYQYIYHSGVLLADLKNPAKLIRVGGEPILSPEMPYELSGHANTVVFSSSQIVEDDGSVKLYYGASDRYQCVADTSVELLLEAVYRK